MVTDQEATVREPLASICSDERHYVRLGCKEVNALQYFMLKFTCEKLQVNQNKKAIEGLSVLENTSSTEAERLDYVLLDHKND
jgi:hypothetical protein